MDEDYDNGKSRNNYDDFGWPYYIGAACACCCFILLLIWLGVLTFSVHDLASRVNALESAAPAGIASRRAGIAPESNGGAAVQLDPDISAAVQRGNAAANSQRWSRLQAARNVDEEKK